MKFSFNPVSNGLLHPNNPGVAELGGTVSPAALGAVREADATMSADDWEYAPVVAPAGWLPQTPLVSADTR